MRNILAFVGALIVTLVAVGWYENWFQLRTTPGADGNRNISIDIDSKKVDQDVKQAEKFIDDEAKKVQKITPPATSPAPPFNPAVQAKDSVKDPKFHLDLGGPAGNE